MSLSKRLKANFLAHVGSQFVTIFSQLVLVPLFIAKWGTHYYGEWLLIYTIPGYLSISDFGVGQVAGNRISILSGKGDHAESLKVLHTAWVIQTAISALVLCAAVPIILWFNFAKYLKLSVIDPADIKIIAGALCIYVLMNFQAGLSCAIFRTRLDNSRIVMWSNIQRFGEAIAIGVALFLRGDAVHVALTMLGFRFFTFACIQLDARRRCPSFHLGWRHFSKSEGIGLIRPATTFLFFPAGNSLVLQGATMVIGITLGPTSVVMFNTTRTLCRITFQSIYIITNAIWPEFSVLLGASDFARLQKLRGIAIQATMLLSSAAVLVLLIVGPWFISVWTRGQVHPSRLFMMGFSVQSIATSTWYVNYILIAAGNEHIRLAKRFLLGSFLVLPATYGLTKMFGIEGAPWGALVLDVTMIGIASKEACRVLKIDPNIAAKTKFSFAELTEFAKARLQRGN